MDYVQLRAYRATVGSEYSSNCDLACHLVLSVCVCEFHVTTVRVVESVMVVLVTCAMYMYFVPRQR